MWVYRALILAVLLHTCLSRSPKHRICQKTIYMNCGNKDSKDSSENGGFIEVPLDSTPPPRVVPDDADVDGTTENPHQSGLVAVLDFWITFPWSWIQLLY